MVTGVGKFAMSVPKLNVKTWPRYVTYWDQSEPFARVPPSMIASAFSASGVRPGNFAMMDCTGLPGIARGMKKLRVIATHAATK